MALFKLSRRHFINWRMLTTIGGWLLIIESLFMFIPLITAVGYDEADWAHFAITLGITLLVGIIMAHYGRPTSQHLGKRDGFLLTALVWVVFSLFGMIPFLLGRHAVSLSEAFFEAISGFTTTGATVIADTSAMSHSMHIWRALMQWIGGMGIILFTLAVIPMLNHSGGMQMFNAEVTGITHDKIRPRISQTAKCLWTIYISLTIVLILLLWAGPMTLFDSVCHALGTVSTGGYSTHPSGIQAWDHSAYVKLVLTAFMFLGGVNFVMIYKTLQGNFDSVRHNDVFRTYVGVIVAMLIIFALVIICRGEAGSVEDVIVDPLFQIVSTITSTGYSIANYEAWGPLAVTLILMMMFSGGCAGSTSGGAKIDRMIYMFKNSHNELYRSLYPNAIMSVKVNGRVVSQELVMKVMAFLGLFALLIAGGGTALAACGVPVVDAYFAAFSCMSNTGLEASITGYGADYLIMPDAAKWILSFLMLTGRLEIYTVLVLFMPQFWRH